jgi:hypothetical protein
MNVSGNTSTSYILELARSFPALERKLNHYHPDQFDADEFSSASPMVSASQVEYSGPSQ